MEHPVFSLSVVLRYVLLPAAVLALITLWHLRTGRPQPVGPVRSNRAVWWLIAVFWGVYGTMGVLRYRAYRTTIQDLGVYDQQIWALSNVLVDRQSTCGTIVEGAVIGGESLLFKFRLR